MGHNTLYIFCSNSCTNTQHSNRLFTNMLERMKICFSQSIQSILISGLPFPRRPAGSPNKRDLEFVLFIRQGKWRGETNPTQHAGREAEPTHTS